MKKTLIIICAIFFIGIFSYLFFDKNPNAKNVPVKNETILIFGDSLAEGVGATEGNDLASRLGTRLGRSVLNYGKSGDTSYSALKRLLVASEEDPGMVIVILGGNDVLEKIPKEETFSNLEKIITFFQNNGAVVVLVGVRSGLIGDGRGDDYSALAEKTGSFYISDILKNVFGNSKYMSDTIHPNDAGYALIEERFFPIITDLLKK